MRIALLIAALALSVSSVSAAPKVTETSVTLGDRGDTVRVRVSDYDRPGITLVALHENESTSVEAALPLFKTWKRGTLVTLHQAGRRNITFRLGKLTCVADPNRIFTIPGRKATLEKLSPGCVGKAEGELEKLADSILAQLTPASGAVVLALHNNSPGRYSFESYVTGEYRKETAETHRGTNKDPDDFFLTTSDLLYAILSHRDMNVVLDTITSASDDGSLSVYAKMNDMIYVNVEAEEGKLEEQRSMIATVFGIVFGGVINQ